MIIFIQSEIRACEDSISDGCGHIMKKQCAKIRLEEHEYEIQ